MPRLWTMPTSRTRRDPSVWRVRSCCRRRALWRAHVRGPFLPRCSFVRPAVRPRDPGYLLVVIMAACSSRGHRCLDLLPYRHLVMSSDLPSTSRRCEACFLPSLPDHALLGKVCSDMLESERPCDPQGPRERLATLREIEACQIGVQVRPPPRHTSANIWSELTTNCHRTHQVRPRRPGATPHTCADRLRTACAQQSISLHLWSGRRQREISGGRTAMRPVGQTSRNLPAPAGHCCLPCPNGCRCASR